jgi:hypothetical protein
MTGLKSRLSKNQISKYRFPTLFTIHPWIWRSTILRNVGWISPAYTALYQLRQNRSSLEIFLSWATLFHSTVSYPTSLEFSLKLSSSRRLVLVISPKRPIPYCISPASSHLPNNRSIGWRGTNDEALVMSFYSSYPYLGPDILVTTLFSNTSSLVSSRVTRSEVGQCNISI